MARETAHEQVEQRDVQVRRNRSQDMPPRTQTHIPDVNLVFVQLCLYGQWLPSCTIP
jgi:hypothetical protein